MLGTAAYHALSGVLKAARICSPASDARPLYLMTTSNCVVDLDGPALVVRAGRRMKGLYPLGRVSRIVSTASVDWKGRAVSACLARGIPIVLLAADGSPVGYVQPPSMARSSLDRLLCELVEHPDWQEHHGNWLRAERMHVVQAWLRHRNEEGQPLSDAERGEVVRRYVYVPDQSSAQVRRAGIYQAALMALCCEKIRKAGLASRYYGYGGAELHLAADLCELLLVALDLELQGSICDAAEELRISVRVFEAYTEGLEQRVGEILGRLHGRVLRLMREWR